MMDLPAPGMPVINQALARRAIRGCQRSGRCNAQGPEYGGGLRPSGKLTYSSTARRVSKQ